MSPLFLVGQRPARKGGAGKGDTRRSNNALSPPALRLQASDRRVLLGGQSAGVTPVSTATRSQFPSSKDPTRFLDGENLRCKDGGN